MARRRKRQGSGSPSRGPFPGGTSEAMPSGLVGRMQRKRSLSDDEAALWAEVAQSVQPIRGHGKDSPRVPFRAVGDDSRLPQPPHPPHGHNLAGIVDKAQQAISSAADKTRSATPAPNLPSWQPPMATPATGPSEVPNIEPRKARRIARGHVPLDDVLDLHGMRQHEAQSALHGFLMRAQRSGFRFVKVITGKGSTPRNQHNRGSDHPEDIWSREQGGGVLRRMVPQWLASPEMRALVAGTRSAGRGHGGDGALYIQIKQLKRRSRSD